MSGSWLHRLGVALLCLHWSVPVTAQDWFDDYDRGLSALESGDADAAIASLASAARKRTEPGENLITYGTNRLDAYYPYLKLAEAYWLAGRLDDAESALDRSAEYAVAPTEERADLAERLSEARDEERASTLPPAPPPPPPKKPPAEEPEEQTAAAAPTTGTLAVASEPPEASVLANGRFLGSTPLEVELEPGEYRVEIRKERQQEHAQRIVIAAGEKSSLDVTLEPLPPPVETPATTTTPVASTAPPIPEPEEPSQAISSETEENVDTSDDGSNVEPPLTSVPPLAARPETATATDSAPVTLVALVVAVAIALVAGVALSRGIRRPTSDIDSPTERTRPDGSTEEVTLATPVRQPSLGEEGGTFGGYRLVEAIGKGGMASVYRAERGGDLVALKRPHDAIVGISEFRARFLREAEIGRTLHHPNIIRIFEEGEVAGVPYFTMELVQGTDLNKRLKADPPPTARESAEIVAQIAEALDYAHLKGVVHRDLKPSNIMVLTDGTVKVMDYGISQARRFEGLTLTGAFIGTPDYTSPEAAEGKGTDARSDLYSLGIIFYELLTRQRPFTAENPLAMLKKQSSEPPTPPSLVSPGCPKELETMILKLLAKDPEDRYPDAEHFLIDLRAYLRA